jgi:hypothetical protein
MGFRFSEGKLIENFALIQNQRPLLVELHLDRQERHGTPLTHEDYTRT